MTKRISLILTLTVLLSLLAGCMGTPVVICNENTTPAEAPVTDAATTPGNSGEAVKTGLAIIATAAESASADGETDGTAKFDVTTVAVTVDDAGVIVSCKIDSIPASVTFNAAGAITSDLSAPVLTKNELGDDYGMKKYAGSAYEWYEQVDALAKYAEGKTADQLKNGAVGEDGKAKDADLATTATIYLGGYVSAIEEAVKNATHLGAQRGDELRLASINALSSSADVGEEKPGLAQLDSNVTALTVRDGVITSCYIDALQAKVNFDAQGAITSDLTAPILTKNQLGDDYGMKAWGGATYEWYEQAASFASYVTGKTAPQIAGIADASSDADLAATVTISIDGFQALILKAVG